MTDVHALAQDIVDAEREWRAASANPCAGQARQHALRKLDDAEFALGLALASDENAYVTPDGAKAILDAIVKERHQQIRRMIAAAYWRAGGAYLDAKDPSNSPTQRTVKLIIAEKLEQLAHHMDVAQAVL